MNVLITGASSGIGAALAKRMARDGDTVGLVARRAERLEEVLAECRKLGAGEASRVWAADLDDLDRAEQVTLEAWDAFGHLDVIVHNAAIPKRRRVQELTFDEVERVMRINYLAPAKMTLAILPRMIERDSGTIVNVASMGGRLGIVHEAAYCASKFALSGWSEVLAIDLYGTGVKVKLIQPGPIDTEIWDLPDNDVPLYDGEKVPPEEVADGIVAALASDKIEHYLPDMSAVVEMKTKDLDGFLSAVAQMAQPKG
jgi:short-subunit dehydrogenase